MESGWFLYKLAGILTRAAADQARIAADQARTNENLAELIRQLDQRMTAMTEEYQTDRLHAQREREEGHQQGYLIQ